MSESDYDFFDHYDAQRTSHDISQIFQRDSENQNESNLSSEAVNHGSGYDSSDFDQRSDEESYHEMSDHLEETSTSSHLSRAELSVLWENVDSFRRQMLHERNGQGYFPGSSVWTSMTCKERRDFALDAVQETLLDQLEAIIEVR